MDEFHDHTSEYSEEVDWGTLTEDDEDVEKLFAKWDEENDNESAQAPAKGHPKQNNYLLNLGDLEETKKESADEDNPRRKYDESLIRKQQLESNSLRIDTGGGCFESDTVLESFSSHSSAPASPAMISYITPTTCISAVGNNLRFFSEEGTQSHLLGLGNGISILATNPLEGLYAYAEDQYYPTIHIMKYPQQILYSSLRGGATIRYIWMDFSRDGQKLVSLSSLPDFQLTVWNLESAQVVALRSLDHISYGSAEMWNNQSLFDPRNPSQIALTWGGDLLFFDLVKKYKKSHLEPVRHFTAAAIRILIDQELAKVRELNDASVEGISEGDENKDNGNDPSTSEETTEKPLPLENHQSPVEWALPSTEGEEEKFNQFLKTIVAETNDKTSRNPFHPICWTTDSKVFYGTSEGILFLFDPQQKEPVAIYNLRLKGITSITHMILTKFHLLVGTKQGEIAWVPLSDPGEVLCMVHARGFGGGIARMSIAPNFQKLIFETTLGSFQQLPLMLVGNQPDDPTVISECHFGKITGVDTLPLQHRIVSTSTDCTLRIWDYKQKTQPLVTLRTFPVALNCVSACKNSSLIAVGTVTGHLIILETKPLGREAPVPVLRLKIHATPVTKVKFHPGGNFLATGTAEGQVSIIDVSTPQFKVIGYLELKNEVLDIDWFYSAVYSEHHLFFSIEGGNVFRVTLPEQPGPEFDKRLNITGPLPLMLSNKLTQKSLMKIGFAADGLCLHQTADSTGGCRQNFFVVCRDKKLKKYQMPERTGDPDLMDDLDITAPKEEHKSHDKPGCSVKISPDGKWLCSAGADGVIHLRKPPHLKKVLGFKACNSLEGGARFVSFSYDSQYFVYASEYQIFVRQIPVSEDGGPSPEPNSQTTTPANLVSDLKPMKGLFELPRESIGNLQNSQNELSVLEKQEKQQQDMKAAQNKKAKDKLGDVLDKIVSRFREVLARNEKLPPLEKFGPNELLVDIEEKERLEKEGHQRVFQLEDQTKKRNLINDLLVERLRGEFWDSQEDHSIIIKAFNTKDEVSNYPLRIRTSPELAFLQKIKLLRRIEIEIFRRRQLEMGYTPPNQNENSNIFSTSIRATQLKYNDRRSLGHIVSDAKEKATTKQRKAKIVSNSDSEDDRPSSVEEEMDELDFDELQFRSIADYLYHPFDLHTPKRKKTHIFLLYFLIYDIKERFNQELKKLLDSKRTDIAKVAEKHNRIKEILNELGQNYEFNPLTMNEGALPEHVFEIKQSEIKAARHLAREEDKGEDNINKGNQQSADEISNDLALKMMMGGTLDGKISEQNFDTELECPEWMNGPEDQMTEDELRKVKEFEKMVETLKEEKQKHRKALETELKKIKVQINEISTKFDEKLAHFYLKKVKTDLLIVEKELMIAKLCHAIMVEEENLLQEQVLFERLDDLKRQKTKSTTTLTEFKTQLDDARNEYEMNLHTDKIIEKSFRRDFEKEREEHFPLMLKIFRKRERNPEHVNAGSTSHVRLQAAQASKSVLTLNSVSNTSFFSSSSIQTPSISQISFAEPSDDPFAFYDQLLTNKFSSRLNVASNPNSSNYFLEATYIEKPADTIDDFTWERLMEVRAEKIASENDLKKKSEVLEKMQRYYNELLAADEAIKENLENTINDVSVFREKQLWDSCNLAMLFDFKQGQVEVEQQAVVTDYSDAIVIPMFEIEDLNSKIKYFSVEKVNLLKLIKNTKKLIRTKTWENRGLDMVAEDLSNKVKFFQLLRVTKQLQDFIKGGEEDMHQQEITLLENRSRHGSNSHSTKMNELKNSLRKIDRQIKEKISDNDHLSTSLKELEGAVSERRKLRAVQGNGPGLGSTAVDNETRFKKVLRSRTIVERVRQQNEEIEQLKSDLLRTRKRTFPQFG